MKTLSQCVQGDRVAICRIHGDGLFRKRLMEMGFHRGAQIHIVRYAPMRDPMELSIKNYSLSLRVEEAARIEVETGPSCECQPSIHSEIQQGFWGWIKAFVFFRRKKD